MLWTSVLGLVEQCCSGLWLSLVICLLCEYIPCVSRTVRRRSGLLVGNLQRLKRMTASNVTNAEFGRRVGSLSRTPRPALPTVARSSSARLKHDMISSNGCVLFQVLFLLLSHLMRRIFRVLTPVVVRLSGCKQKSWERMGVKKGNLDNRSLPKHGDQTKKKWFTSQQASHLRTTP